MKRKLKICFYSPKRYSFYYGDYLGRGLGGTENMLVGLSVELAKRGHDVTIFNCCFKTGTYHDVKWKNIWEFDNSEYYDLFISLRLLETFREIKNINSPLRGVWIHDESLEGASELDKSDTVNFWIFVSKLQHDLITSSEHLQSNNCYVSRNAYDSDLFKANVIGKKNHNRMLYCSAPDRGLQYLIDYWPEIKNELPDATLDITGSFSLWGMADEENSRIFDKVYKKINERPEITLHGRVDRLTLIKLQEESSLMLYPAIFNEMYCISALECLVSGTPVISSDKGDLKSRVKDGESGYLIQGHPSTLEFKNEFLSKLFEICKSKEIYNKMSKSAYELNKNYSLENLALEWEKEIYNRLNDV